MSSIARNGKALKGIIDFIKFIFPALALYLVFFMVPLIQTIVYSFTDWNGIARTRHFIGIQNYLNILKDDLFFNAMKFTFSYAVLYMVAVNIIALVFAFLLNKNLRTKTALRAIMFTPFVFNDVTVGFLWQFLLGRVMSGLYEATHWEIFGISWLSDTRIVIYSIVMVKIWQSMGYFMVIYLAGMQMVPKEPLEAAMIDGARSWTISVKIVLPLLMPTMAVCVFLSLTDALHMFPLLMTLTSGGPGHATESISLYIYNQAFNNQQMGYASSLAVILTLIVLLITSIQLSIFRKREVHL